MTAPTTNSRSSSSCCCRCASKCSHRSAFMAVILTNSCISVDACVVHYELSEMLLTLTLQIWCSAFIGTECRWTATTNNDNKRDIWRVGPRMDNKSFVSEAHATLLVERSRTAERLDLCYCQFLISYFTGDFSKTVEGISTKHFTQTAMGWNKNVGSNFLNLYGSRCGGARVQKCQILAGPAHTKSNMTAKRVNF